VTGLLARPAAGVLRPAQRIAGEVDVPADKSIAHRALICAALAHGRSTIELRLPGRDVRSTIHALRALGVTIEGEHGDGDAVRVAVDGLGSRAEIGLFPGGTADCGNSGTTMRLLTGAVAASPARALLTGDASLSRRPMERVAAPLRAMGAKVYTDAGHAPVRVQGGRPLRALAHDLPVASAQVLGAVALAALAADGSTTVRLPGATRDHTERLLAAAGATVERRLEPDGSTLTTIDGPAVLSGQDVSVPGDFSSAAAWIVAASIHPAATVRLPRLGLNPTRTALLDVLREMGARIEVGGGGEQAGEPVGEVLVGSAPGGLRGVSVGPGLVPALIDELPLLAVAMASARGTSEVRGAGELRLKESDRVASVAAALAAIGARVEELTDGWRIGAGPPREAAISTEGDHRVAMALSVAAWTGVAAGVSLDDPECVAVSYPSFWADAARLGLAR
jgi:3-phosphoshikimate 1-carboxyvinyltransferase